MVFFSHWIQLAAPPSWKIIVFQIVVVNCETHPLLESLWDSWVPIMRPGIYGNVSCKMSIEISDSTQRHEDLSTQFWGFRKKWGYPSFKDGKNKGKHRIEKDDDHQGTNPWLWKHPRGDFFHHGFFSGSPRKEWEIHQQIVGQLTCNGIGDREVSRRNHQLLWCGNGQ